MSSKPSTPSAADASEGDDDVGYCKPPKHTRFKPGQSGNPRGRPRGARNFKTAVREALQEKITIREGNKTRKLSKMDAIVQVAFAKALKGDLKGLATVIQMVRSVGLMDEEPLSSSIQSVSVEDEAILARFLERHGVRLHSLKGEDSPTEAEAVTTDPKSWPKRGTTCGGQT